MIIVQTLKSVLIGIAVFALHGLLLWHLIQQAPAKTPLPTTPKPIMVNLITPPPPVKTPAPVLQPVKPVPKKTIIKKPVKKLKKVKRVKRVKKVKKIVKKRKKWVKPAKTKKPRVKPKTTSVKRQAVSHPIPVAQTVPMPTTRQTAIAQPIAKAIRTANSSQEGQNNRGNSRHVGRQFKVATTPPSYKAAYLHNPPPAYPRISKRRGEEGKVLLRVKVNQQGKAAVVKLHQSSGSTRLDNAARQAVNQWRFVPAKKAGQSVSGWVIVPLVFKLR